MTKAIFTLLYKATKMFESSYIPNKAAPFVLMGFGGISITDNGLVQIEVRMPHKWTSLLIKSMAPIKVARK